MLCIQYPAPNIAATLAAPIVKSKNRVILFIVQNDIKIWFIIQHFVAIMKSATLDPQQLSQAPLYDLKSIALVLPAKLKKA